MLVIDSHCHLDMIESRGLLREAIQNTLTEYQTTGFIHIAADKEGVAYLTHLEQENWPCLFWFTIGRHPGEAHLQDGYDGLLEIERYQNHALFCAIGEIGLDYHYHKETRTQQIKTLEAYLEKAMELQKPVCIHTRDAFADTQAILKKVQDKIPVIIHCFTGTRQEMFAFLDMGFFISFSGIVTFKNATHVQEAATACPREKLLVETDAPFLAPVPHRGKTNQPAYVRHTLEFIIQQRQEDPREFAQCVLENTQKAFGLTTAKLS